MKFARLSIFVLLFGVSGSVSAEIVFNSIGPSTNGGQKADFVDQLIAQQFLLGDNDTVISATIEMESGGSPKTVNLEIWDDSGSGTPRQFVGLLGSIDAADIIIGGDDTQYTVDTPVFGLTPNEPYYLVMSFEDVSMPNFDSAFWRGVRRTSSLAAANGSALEAMLTTPDGEWFTQQNYPPGGPPFPIYHTATINAITTVPELLSDLTGNGFVDFEDLTVLLANWNKDVGADAGNLVNADTTPVNFEDLTVLLADWTGPGPAASPEAVLGAEAVPEPSAAVLSLIGCLSMLAWRRKRANRSRSA